jgi:hypothetical protein
MATTTTTTTMQYEQLDRITAAVHARDDQAITRQLHASTLSPEQAALFEQGFQHIRELDSVFLQKNSVARSLKRERLERERAADAVAGDAESDEEEEPDESLELKSVHSYEERTFLTEPRLAVRRAPIGKEALLERGGTMTSTLPTLPSLSYGPATLAHGARRGGEATKAYVPGNFIQRNIAVGGDVCVMSAGWRACDADI